MSSRSSRNRTRTSGSPKRAGSTKTVPLSKVKDDLSRCLRLAEHHEIVISPHENPAGVLIGFGSEDDWFHYRFENDPAFQGRTEAARHSLKAGRGVRLEDTEA